MINKRITKAILAVIIFLFSVWPGFGSVTFQKWIVGVSIVLILLLSYRKKKHGNLTSMGSSSMNSSMPSKKPTPSTAAPVKKTVKKKK